MAKRNGFAASGVDALATAAGLTAGAFYAHFESKAALLEAVVEQELTRSLATFQVETLDEFRRAIAAYLSEGHVEKPEIGCALPTLTAEIARGDSSVRENFEGLLLQIKNRIASYSKDDDQAWSFLAQIVGAVMLARAVATPESRKNLLEGVHRSICTELMSGSVRQNAR